MIHRHPSRGGARVVGEVTRLAPEGALHAVGQRSVAPVQDLGEQVAQKADRIGRHSLPGQRGREWVVPDAGEPTRLGQGDVAILRGQDPYTVADDPATAPQVVIHPDQRCTTPDGEETGPTKDLGCAPGATVPTERR